MTRCDSAEMCCRCKNPVALGTKVGSRRTGLARSSVLPPRLQPGALTFFACSSRAISLRSVFVVLLSCYCRCWNRTKKAKARQRMETTSDCGLSRIAQVCKERRPLHLSSCLDGFLGTRSTRCLFREFMHRQKSECCNCGLRSNSRARGTIPGPSSSLLSRHSSRLCIHSRKHLLTTAGTSIWCTSEKSQVLQEQDPSLSGLT